MNNSHTTIKKARLTPIHQRLKNILLLPVLLTLSLVWADLTYADIVADWGAIPLGSETTFSFIPSDITTNFTDQYYFSLEGITTTSFSIDSLLGLCSKGCGNPEFTYGVYDATGGLIDSTSPVILAAGNYTFQLKGTGMGAGNSIDTPGSVTFFSEIMKNSEIISATPEPSTYLLMLLGLALIIQVSKRQKNGGHDV